MPITASHSPEVRRLANQTLAENRVAIFIVCYNAARHIESVLNRIPDWVAPQLTEIFIIDDSSQDQTIQTAVGSRWSEGNAPLKVFKTPYNQGYGGNQRLGYLYAIDQAFDIVILLHGDGQYAPEFIPEILAEYARPAGADAVYGSRFLTSGGALRGGMPLYKFIGNRILTHVQNRLIGTRLSELHSGYRSYRVAALKKIPFQANSTNFDFDSDIIIQFSAAGLTIREVSIPTYYGDEICHVNGFKYAWACVQSAAQYRLMQWEIFYNPKFDIPNRARKYTIKNSPTSLHHHIRQLPLAPGSTLLDLGGGDGGAVGLAHADRGVNLTVIDQAVAVDDVAGQRTAQHPRLRHVAADLNGDWPATVDAQRFATVFVLDVLEHMQSPEKTAQQIFSVMPAGGKLYASTGNIAYWIIRAQHLLGHFNYGRRGILDLTHTRLFTPGSFQRLLRNAGFQINTVKCFGPPLADLAEPQSFGLRWIDRASARLARLWPNLFGYQILIEATRPDSVETLMKATFLDRRTEPLTAPTITPAPITNAAPPSRPVSAWRRILPNLIIISACAYILAAYASFTRPIWIDEFLHYALGSHRSTTEAWRSISETLPTFNHGQTGVHMLLNYWMLNLFGASAFILRLPSLLAAAFLLFATVQIARHLRFNLAWTLLLLAGFFCQQNLMYFAGEARPYLPLAAAVIGALAFYLVPVEERSGSTRLAGGIALWLGGLFHPYFPIYWLVLATYTYLLPVKSDPRPARLAAFLRHCDMRLAVPAAIACISLAFFTWLKGSPHFQLEPFQWIKGDGLFKTFTRISHFQFLGEAYLIGPCALLIGLLTALITPLRRSAIFRQLAPPLGLLALALGLSLLLSVISYYREYWVLPRQWVASLALCCLAVLWLAKEMATVLNQRIRLLGLPLLGLMAYILYQSVIPVHQMKRNDLRAVWQATTQPTHQPITPMPAELKLPANNEEWVALANQNIVSGGKVWPIFRRFYARPD